MKGRTYEDIYGPEKASELRVNRSKTFSKPRKTKGKTYLEIYGPETAARLTSLRSAQGLHLTSNLKGKTYDEIYGTERSREIRSKRGIKGPANNLWRGGSSKIQLDRGPDWSQIAQAIRRRDYWTCQDCGRKKIRLDVHHIIPYRLYPFNIPELLITLCRRCHTKWDAQWRGETSYSPSCA